MESEMEAEMRFHVEAHAEDLARAGFSEAEALRRARVEFGGVEQAKEECRDARGVAFVESVLQDLRFGMRMLRKNLGFTVVAAGTLALAIGANTALFSVVKAVLLNSLPYREPERLVKLAKGGAGDENPSNVSYGEVEDWKERKAPFQQIALSQGWTPATPTEAHPEMTYALQVTHNFFQLLGVSAAQGRLFLPEEDRPDRWHVAVLSYPYWMRHFGGDPSAVGKTILLDQIPFRIVGVLPQSFQPLAFNDAGSPPEVWVPLGYDRSSPDACRSCQHLQAVARLQDGISIGEARAAMAGTMEQLAGEFPQDYAEGDRVEVRPLREAWYGKVQTGLWLLLGATGLVLLIACANVANLLLARAAQKNREIAVRAALGATRWRLARQLLTESTLLSVLGGAAGIALAVWGTWLLARWAPQQIPRLEDVHVDAGVLFFALLLSTSAGLMMGLVPALQTSRVEHREAMQRSGRGVLGTRSRARSMLVASEVCLAFVLTVASGLLLKSFANAWKVDPGFAAQNLYEVNFTLNGAKYRDEQAVVRAQTETLERLQQIPGIDSVSLASTPPGVGGFGGFDQADFQIQDRDIPANQAPSVDRYIVSADYFRTTGIPVRRGRTFTNEDATGANPVAIVSESTARKIFAGENPLGRRIQLGGRNEKRPWAEIVGVVGDVHQYGLDEPVTPQAYVLYTHTPFPYPTTVLVRSGVAAAALTRAIEEQVWAVDKNTLVFNPEFMSQIVSDSLAERRFTMALLAGFGALALILAAIGIYGVLSCAVAQRTNEFGVRMALGARSSEVGRMVLGEALLLACTAVAVGWVVTEFGARMLRSLLFEVSPNDPATLLGVSGLLLGIVGISALGPVWRATRVEPMVAVRYE